MRKNEKNASKMRKMQVINIHDDLHSCFKNLQQQICLTLYRNIGTFNDPGKEIF